MLFFLLVIALIAGIVLVVHDKFDNTWTWFIGTMTIIVTTMSILISGIIMVDNYGNIEGIIASKNQRYESLTYQLENNLYDNDNDFGKKELYNQIGEWNEDVVYYQNVQDNFWFGIYYPNVFDQFKIIEYK